MAHTPKEIEVQIDTEIQSGEPYARGVTIQLDKQARPHFSAVYDAATKELIPELVAIDIHMNAGELTTATLTRRIEGQYTLVGVLREEDTFETEEVGVVGFTTERW